jgi:DNA-binding MarR family transcriptional regulator
MKRLDTLFLQEKPAKILLFVKGSKRPTYTTIVAKEIGATYAHTFNVLSKLEDLGLIHFERIGRIKLVILTELGKETAEALERFNDMMRLAGLEARIRRIQQKGAGLDRITIAKRLAPCKRELERLARRDPKAKEMAEKLLKRIETIGRSARKSST